MAIDTLSFRQPALQAAAKPESTAAGRRSFRLFGGPVNSREMILFLSQLSLMLEVGTSLTAALTALGRQASNPAFREIIADLCHDIETGRQLSDAMQRYPKVFDGVFVSMIKAGETGGFLNDAIRRIVEMREKREALVAQLKTALTYPAILCVMAVGVVVFVLVGVLPKFMTFFMGKEHLLPLSTRLLVAASHSLRGYWWAYVAGLAAAAAGIRAFLTTPMGKETVDRLSVCLPLVGRMSNRIYTAQVLRTLGHLLESRVPLAEALTVTRTTMGNGIYQRFIERIGERVQQGGRLAQAFTEYPYITPSVKEMIATGEEAGNLYPVMLRLAEYYDTEIERGLKTMASLIEPAALVILGSLVGTIVASVILPIFKLANAVR
jgi:type II secretory pathway component PulF